MRIKSKCKNAIEKYNIVGKSYFHKCKITYTSQIVRLSSKFSVVKIVIVISQKDWLVKLTSDLQLQIRQREF
jgi:hypothetical protein